MVRGVRVWVLPTRVSHPTSLRCASRLELTLLVLVVRDGMMLLDGISKEEANKRFWCIDRNGLLMESMGNSLRHAQLSYARSDEECENWDTAHPDQKGYYLMDGEWCNGWGLLSGDGDGEG